jgi:hypothetical protein
MLEAIVLLSVVPRLVRLVTCYTIGGLTHILLAIAWPSVGLLPPRRISFFSLLGLAFFPYYDEKFLPSSVFDLVECVTKSSKCSNCTDSYGGPSHAMRVLEVQRNELRSN